jgi:hypothetical protein
VFVRFCSPSRLIAVAAFTFASACSVLDDTGADPAAAVPYVVNLTTSDYAFDAPDTIPAGWSTFRLVNEGATLHMAQLVKLDEGRTLEDFREAYYEAWRTDGLRPTWGRRLGGPGAVEPNGSSNATMYLEPGSYAWYCAMDIEDGTPHVFGQSMARSFVVTESEAETTPQATPEPTVTIWMTDYLFGVSDPLTAGRHVIKVENMGVEPHEIGVLKLAPGKTLDDVQTWLEGFQGPPPASAVGGVSALAANAEAYFEAELTPGDYVLVCFVTAPDGRPHTEHGMIQHIRIE